MEINEKYIKVSGRIPININWSLNLSDDVVIVLMNEKQESTQEFIAEVVKTEDFNNQDSTIDRVFVLKPR